MIASSLEVVSQLLLLTSVHKIQQLLMTSTEIRFPLSTVKSDIVKSLLIIWRGRGLVGHVVVVLEIRIVKNSAIEYKAGLLLKSLFLILFPQRSLLPAFLEPQSLLKTL